jgi:hypothetical protein
MKKHHVIFGALAAFALAYLACANAFAQTFVNGYAFGSVDTPHIVIYGSGTNTSAAVKVGQFKCDQNNFPALPRALAASEWPECWVYPIKSVAACVPKIAGGTGVGIKVGASVGIETTGWVSWWCPGTADKTVPVVLTCKGLADCSKSIASVIESNRSFAEAVQAATTTTVTSPEMLPIWQGSVARIAAGRP